MVSETTIRRPRLRKFRRPALVCAAVGALMVLLPAGAGAFQKAIWGPAYRNGKNEFALYHSMGVSLYETDINWAAVAPKKPSQATNPKSRAYRWPKYLTQEVALAKRYGMNVMIQVKGAPAWANGGHHDGSGVTGNEWAPTNATTYAQFVEAVAKKYPSVHLWMIWGEPDRAGDFLPWVDGQQISSASTIDADQRYAQMLNDSYGVLKGLSKKNLVIGGNTWSFGNGVPTLTWMKDMTLPDGGRPRMDMWGNNPFQPAGSYYGSPVFPKLSVSESNAESLGGASDFYDLPAVEAWTGIYFGKPLKLFLSEWNLETELDDTFNSGYLVSQSTAATWTRKALQESQKTSWIYALGWINTYDTPQECSGWGWRSSCSRTTGTGLFYSDGKAKPDEAAWKKYG